MWRQEIPKALRASDFILIFLSQISISKIGYVQNEFKLAIDIWKQIPEGMIHTIPVRLDNCDVPEQFGEFQWVNLFDEIGLNRIIRAIKLGIDQRHLLKNDQREQVLPTQRKDRNVTRQSDEAERISTPVGKSRKLSITYSTGLIPEPETLSTLAVFYDEVWLPNPYELVPDGAPLFGSLLRPTEQEQANFIRQRYQWQLLFEKEVLMVLPPVNSSEIDLRRVISKVSETGEEKDWDSILRYEKVVLAIHTLYVHNPSPALFISDSTDNRISHLTRCPFHKFATSDTGDRL